jgi:hypothetical protein
LAILALSGDKAIDARGEVWNVAVPDIPSYMASIVVVAVTALTASARPVLLTTATPGSTEVQVANAVKFC